MAEILRQHHLLLVLDNFERLLPEHDMVRVLLEACPRLVVMVTSRVALRVRDEREFRVAPLALPVAQASASLLKTSPAVALFLDRARAVGVELDWDPSTASAVVAICQRLDGLPLALELAAAWSRLLSPPALLARLERRLPMLVGGAADLPDRQRTMRSTITWSYDLLNREQQQLFERLCVFVGGCTVEAAEHVCRAGDAAVLRGLADLVDRGLLRTFADTPELSSTQRLGMLETVREFGVERLDAASDAGSIRVRHAAFYLAVAEGAAGQLRGPDGLMAGELLEREHDNVRAALDWARLTGSAELAVRLTGALWPFWSERGYLSEGRRWLHVALELPIRPGETGAAHRAWALVGAAQLAMDQRDHDVAEQLSSEALALARTDDASPYLVAALNVRALVTRERGAYLAAMDLYREALAVPNGNTVGDADALIGLGFTMALAGDIPGGAMYSAQALTLLRSRGDGRALAAALGGMLAHCVHVGDFTQAEKLGREALALARSLRDSRQVSELLFSLALVAQFQGQNDRAALLHEENVELRQERGNERGTIEPLSALATIALQERDYQRARALLNQTLTLLQRFEDRWASAMSHVLLGHVEQASGDSRRAHTLFVESAWELRSIGNALYLPWCLEGLAGVAAEDNDWEQAAKLCGARDALREQLQLGMPPVNPALFSSLLEVIRTELGEAAFAAAIEAGRRDSLDTVLAEASASRS